MLCSNWEHCLKHRHDPQTKHSSHSQEVRMPFLSLASTSHRNGLWTDFAHAFFLNYMELHTISFMVSIINDVSGFTKPRFKSWLHTFSFRLGQIASNRKNDGTYVTGLWEGIINIRKVVEQYLALFSLLLKFWRTR